MKIQTAILLSVSILVGCAGDQEKPESLSDPLARVDTKNQQVSAEDSLKQIRLEKLIDTVLLIKVVTTTKCNLTEGYYVLKNNKVDSSDIHLLTKYLASQLFQNAKKDPSCDYKVMTKAMVYLNMEDYRNDQGNFISICDITPANYEGDVFIQSHKLKQLRN